MNRLANSASIKSNSAADKQSSSTTIATTPSTSNLAGVGTNDKLAKWIDGSSGIIGALAVTETGGNVGIGTNSLTARLDVDGTGRVGQIVLTRAFAAANKGGYLFTGIGGGGPVDAELGFFVANTGTSSGANEGPYFLARGNKAGPKTEERGSLRLYG